MHDPHVAHTNQSVSSMLISLLHVLLIITQAQIAEALVFRVTQRIWLENCACAEYSTLFLVPQMMQGLCALCRF